MDNLRIIGLIFCFLISKGLSNGAHLSIRPSATEVSHFVNDSHIVFCSSQPQQNVQIEWISPQGVVINLKKGRIHIEEKSDQLALVFEHISLIDKGIWTCRTIDGATQSFVLLVNQKISFVDTNSMQSVKEGLDAFINCRVNGDPKPTLSWYRNGDVIKFPNSVSKQLSDGLFIKRVTQMDAGEYTCRAYQISETVTDVQERTVLLKIQHKPLWLSNDTVNIQYGYMNGNVNLSCAAVAEPPATFTWIYDGKAIAAAKDAFRVHTDVYQSSLELRIRNISQFGEYKCKVANALGSLERVIKLKQGLKPHQPSTFRLRDLYAKSLEFDLRSRTYSDEPENMDINGYRVEYMTEYEFKFVAGNWTFARKKDFEIEEGVQFTITDLEQNTTYYTRAASKNLAGLSDWTKIELFTTLANAGSKGFITPTQYIVCFLIAPFFVYLRV